MMTEQELAKEVANGINNMCFSDEEFCKEMHKQHRTLQQNFMRLIVEYIRTTAEQEFYDDRNEASVEAAKKLLKTIEDENIFLPYI